jgi:anti-sigma B factor antagonist
VRRSRTPSKHESRAETSRHHTSTFDDAVTIAIFKSSQSSVTVTGEVDASNAAEMCLALLDAARRGRPPLEVDLAGVTFMDSTGLRAIDEAAKTLAVSGSRLVLHNAPRHVLRIIEIMGIGETVLVST